MYWYVLQNNFRKQRKKASHFPERVLLLYYIALGQGYWEAFVVALGFSDSV